MPKVYGIDESLLPTDYNASASSRKSAKWADIDLTKHAGYHRVPEYRDKKDGIQAIKEQRGGDTTRGPGGGRGLLGSLKLL